MANVRHLTHVGLQFRLGRCPAAGPVHDRRGKLLAEIGMRQADRGGPTIGVAHQRRLDMRAGDVLPPRITMSLLRPSVNR